MDRRPGQIAPTVTGDNDVAPPSRQETSFLFDLDGTLVDSVISTCWHGAKRS